MRFCFNVNFTKRGRHAHELGEFGIVVTARKADYSKGHEDSKRHRSVTPCAAECARQFTSKETAYMFAPLRIGPIDAAMRANDKTVQVINQTRVARFRASNRQIRGRATIDASQFAHFLALQASQRSSVEQR